MTDKPTRRADRFAWRKGDLVMLEPREELPPRRPRGRASSSAGPAIEFGELRRARNVTQVQLAEALGVDQGRISRLERLVDPQLSSVLAYLRALGVREVELGLTFEDGTHLTLPIAASD